MIEDTVRKNGYLSLGSRLKRIGERLQADVQAVIDDYGFPIQAHHYNLFFALDENGPLEIGQLARALGISQPGVTRSVGHLRAADCVRIAVSNRDKRVRRVELTEQGEEILRVGRREIGPRLLLGFDEIFKAHEGELLPLLGILEDALSEATLAEIADRREKGVKA
ncbi:MAG: MarR family transcriptional regulator [Boseongicola sp.]|nr:MarR family transcriptional regulator [Boseongicola sp.]